MGRGDRKSVRWKRVRQDKKKARDKKHAQERSEARRS